MKFLVNTKSSKVVRDSIFSFISKTCTEIFISVPWHLIAVKFEAKLDDGTVVAKSDGVEFTVRDGKDFSTVFTNYIVH